MATIAAARIPSIKDGTSTASIANPAAHAKWKCIHVGMRAIECFAACHRDSWQGVGYNKFFKECKMLERAINAMHEATTMTNTIGVPAGVGIESIAHVATDTRSKAIAMAAMRLRTRSNGPSTIAFMYRRIAGFNHEMATIIAAAFASQSSMEPIHGTKNAIVDWINCTVSEDRNKTAMNGSTHVTTTPMLFFLESVTNSDDAILLCFSCSCWTSVAYA